AGRDRVIFSLDLFDGYPRMAAIDAWGSDEPSDVAREAIACGVRSLILLDLARVGTGRGPGTDHLLGRIVRDHPGVRPIQGGGISTIDDVLAQKNAGAAAVLVGSALHDGRINALDLERLGRDPAACK